MASRVSSATTVVLVLQCLFLAVNAQQQAFSVEPSDSTVTEGSSITLICTITNKAGIATWIKGGSNPISVNDRIIDTSNNRFSIVGDLVSEFNLKISNANVSDAGEYACQVSASGSSSEIVSPAAVLTVLNVQKFRQQPADTSGSGDSTITLMCAINNKEGFLSWRRDGSIISNETRMLNSNPRFSIVGDQSAGEYNLQIIATQEQDEAIYECFVTASGSSPYIESSSAFLNIISSGSQRLTVVPTDTVVTEGTTATMRCRVADKAGVLSWLQNGQAISYDSVMSLSDIRYSIVGNGTLGEFDLQITEVTSDDQATYHCIVNAEGNNDAISSSGANLITRPAEAPDANYPQCFISPSGDLQEGANVTLSCLSRGGEPQPDLFWLKNSQDFEGNLIQYDTYSRNEVDIVLTNDLIGTVFECQATHPAFDSTMICSLPALEFELTPTITVSLDTEERKNVLNIKEDESGEVTCFATGDPSILGYSWFYNGVEISDIDERFVWSSPDNTQSTLTITAASLSMDESVISCHARNRIDTASKYTIVRIDEDNFYTILLAILGMVAIFVFVLIIVPCIVYYCWNKQNKLNKSKREIVPLQDIEIVSSVSKQVPNNYFTETETKLPNGTAKKNKRSHSKVISHEADNGVIPTTVVLRGNPGSVQRISAFNDLYPPIEPSTSPMLNGRKATYDMQSGRLRSGSVISSASYALPQTPASGRRDSRSNSFAPSILTPGEALRKLEYDRKARELENMRRSLTDAGLGLSTDGGRSSSKKKHRSKDEKKHRHKHKEGRESKEHKHDKEHRSSKDKKEKKHKHKKDKHDKHDRHDKH